MILSVMACNLKIQKIYHWRVVILNWPFPVLCRDPPICKFCRFKTFSRFKSLTFQKNWKNFWPIQFVRVFSLNEEIGHIPKLHLNFTKNVKKKKFCEQSASPYSLCLNKVLSRISNATRPHNIYSLIVVVFTIKLKAIANLVIFFQSFVIWSLCRSNIHKKILH